MTELEDERVFEENRSRYEKDEPHLPVDKPEEMVGLRQSLRHARYAA